MAHPSSSPSLLGCGEDHVHLPLPHIMSAIGYPHPSDGESEAWYSIAYPPQLTPWQEAATQLHAPFPTSHGSKV